MKRKKIELNNTNSAIIIVFEHTLKKQKKIEKKILDETSKTL